MGEPGADRALLWSRAPGARRAEVAWWPEDEPSARRETALPVRPERDATIHVPLEGLRPGTRYRYLVRFAAGPGPLAARSAPLEGAFRTAPAASDAAPLRLAFGGDLAGQNVCRDAAEGFPVFRTLRARRPDVFVALGDLVYADAVCEAVGRYGNAQVPGGFRPSVVREDFLAHWRYAREDPSFRAFLATTAMVAVWDDHEVLNDFGPHHDTPRGDPGRRLLPLGRQAFLDWNPVAADDPTRLHRRLRLGRHLELFVLDTRGHRDPNAAPDRPEAPKSLLGAAQREWLVRGLAASDATWKVVVSSVPIAIPTGALPDPSFGRDGWADYDQDTGFEHELRALLVAARDAGVRGLLFLTTDVHFATLLRYRPFPETPEFVLHEVVTGPLQAGVFPKRELDPTFRPERLFFHGPEHARAIADFAEATGWFNFGELDVAASGDLTVRVIDARGRILHELPLAPPRARR